MGYLYQIGRSLGTWQFAAGLAIVALGGVCDSFGQAAALDPAKIDATRERLEQAEERALFYKFDDLLREEDEFRTGEVLPGLLKANEADVRAAQEVLQAVNTARREFFAIFGEDVAAEQKRSRRYVAERKQLDDKKIQEVSGTPILSIAGPTWAMERLMPALAAEFLRKQRPAMIVGQKRLGDTRYLYQLSDTGRIAIKLVERGALNSKEIALLKCDLVLSAELPSRDFTGVFAWGGVGVLTCPLNKLNQVSVEDVRALLKAHAKWPPSAGISGDVHWIAVKNDPSISEFAPAVATGSRPALSLDSYEALEQEVFRDQQAMALVPLGLCAGTDNRVLRLTTKSDPYGLRPTPLTARENYPWRLGMRLTSATPQPSPAAQEFQKFLRQPEGLAAITEEGYAPALP